MQLDFHYYATYCAAYLAGFSHDESCEIAYSAQFVDCCSKTLLKKIKAPQIAATTQLQLEMMEEKTDIVGLQDITRIWSAFHFLPRDLYAEYTGHNGTHPYRTKSYLDKYRLICGPNGQLVKDTVELSRGCGTQALGVAMHVLADTWAHRYFAGTPSLVINNTDFYFYELVDENGEQKEKQVIFNNNPASPDDVDRSYFTNTVNQLSENAIMNLGHGRAGHLPDYSYIVYKYLPAWGDYEEIVKNNPDDYYHAFCQMVYAMKCIKTGVLFETGKYDFDSVSPYREEIECILKKRQLDASADWKAFGQKLSGQELEDFDIEKYQQEYVTSPDKDATFLGKFIKAAGRQKSRVTDSIYKSGNLLAGFSLDITGTKAFIKNYLNIAGKSCRKADGGEGR